MTINTSPNPLAYTGLTPSINPGVVSVDRPPTVNDWQSFEPGNQWIDVSATPPGIYECQSVAGNQAIWLNLGGSSSSSVQLTGNSGVAVQSGNNINVFGSGNIVTSASGATLTASITGTIPVANGGTGASTLTGILFGNGTSSVTGVEDTGVLIGQGASAPVANATLGMLEPIIGGTTGTNTLTSVAFPLTPSQTGYPFVAPNSTTSPTFGLASVPGGGTGVGSWSNVNSVVLTGTTMTGSFQSVAGTGTTGQVLTSNGAGVIPSWQTGSGGGAVQLTGNSGTATESGGNINVVGSGNITTSGTGSTLTASITGTIPVPNGGTGVNSWSNVNSLVVTGTTSTGNFQSVVGTGTTGQILTSNGTGTLPSWQNGGGGGGDITSIITDSGTITPSSGIINLNGSANITTSGTGNTGVITLTGTVPVANGGTGVDTISGILFGDGIAPLTGVEATGILFGNGTSPPTGVEATGILIGQGAVAPIANSTLGTLQPIIGGTSGANTLTSVAFPTTPSQVGYPFVSPNSTTSPVFGIASVPGGGTGSGSWSNLNSVLLTGTTSTGNFQSVVGTGTSGQVLTSNGTGVIPSWQTGSGGGGVSSVNVKTFTASGTYTPTTNMVYCIIELVGGGGQGGGGIPGNATSTLVGSGGGAGGYAKGLFTAAQIGTSKAVTIGSGGSGTSSLHTAGASGTATSVGSLISATGGAGGQSGTGSDTYIYYVGGAGGTGTGTITLTGQMGQAGSANFAGTSGVFTYYSALSGSGGSSPFGYGGAGQFFTVAGNSNPGIAGSGHGSGGGGAATINTNTQQNGGAGTNGIVVITEFIS